MPVIACGNDNLCTINASLFVIVGQFDRFCITFCKVGIFDIFFVIFKANRRHFDFTVKVSENKRCRTVFFNTKFHGIFVACFRDDADIVYGMSRFRDVIDTLYVPNTSILSFDRGIVCALIQNSKSYDNDVVFTLVCGNVFCRKNRGCIFIWCAFLINTRHGDFAVFGCADSCTAPTVVVDKNERIFFCIFGQFFIAAEEFDCVGVRTCRSRICREFFATKEILDCDCLCAVYTLHCRGENKFFTDKICKFGYVGSRERRFLIVRKGECHNFERVFKHENESMFTKRKTCKI